jgi:hypothetical protein
MVAVETPGNQLENHKADYYGAQGDGYFFKVNRKLVQEVFCHIARGMDVQNCKGLNIRAACFVKNAQKKNGDYWPYAAHGYQAEAVTLGIFVTAQRCRANAERQNKGNRNGARGNAPGIKADRDKRPYGVRGQQSDCEYNKIKNEQ